MARNPRQDTPGSWHHVMNRGIARRTLFETAADIRFFLSRFARAVRRGDLEVHAYAILTTHFHLLVRSPRGRLSLVMKVAQNEYVRRFNRERRRDGPLVRGRFASKPVTTERYRATLLRYVDHNPVDAGLVETEAREIEAQSIVAHGVLKREPREPAGTVDHGAVHERRAEAGDEGRDAGAHRCERVMGEGRREFGSRGRRDRARQGGAQLVHVLLVAELRTLVEPFGNHQLGGHARLEAPGRTLDPHAQEGLGRFAQRHGTEAERQAQLNVALEGTRLDDAHGQGRHAGR